MIVDNFNLQENDSKMIFTDTNDKDKVYQYDMIKGKIVNEFQPQKKHEI